MGMYADHFDFAVPLLWTAEAVLSETECAALLDRCSHAEWLAATVNSAEGRVVDATIRSNRTAVLREPELAALLYERLRPHLPGSMVDRLGGQPRRVVPVGLYQPLRIYRYDAGQRFGLHHDQAYQDGAGRRSLLTLLVYLNKGYAGGETTFPEQERTITPRTGAALLFQHMLLHAGAEVTAGLKYVLRTDVIFGEPP